MKTLSKDDLSRIGIVNKTYGFKGMVSCLLDLSSPEKLLKKKFLFVLLEGLPVPFAVEEIELTGNELFIKFEDINSVEEAKKLLRKELFSEKISRKKTGKIVSWKDLKNFTAIDESFGEIGLILDVLEYPMQMIARCEINGKEVLFPLNEDIVMEVDEREKMVFIELPPGLLDVYLK